MVMAVYERIRRDRHHPPPSAPASAHPVPCLRRSLLLGPSARHWERVPAWRPSMRSTSGSHFAFGQQSDLMMAPTIGMARWSRVACW